MTGRLGRLRPMSGFGKTLAGSVILHAALIALAALLYASGAGRVFITPVYTVDLVSSGPAAPKAAAEPIKEETPLPEPAKPEEPLEKKAAGHKTPAETLKVKEEPSVDAALKKIEKKVERRKDQSLVDTSIEDLRKKMEAEKKSREERVSKLRQELASRQEPAKPAPASKPQAAAVNPAGGAPKANLETKYPAYYGLLRDKVQENWIYPEGLKDDRISVIVSIKIARTGKLLDVAVEKSSGDQAFDSSLLKAVRKAAPFPPLPVDMEGSFLETGLRFCPGCAQ